MPGEFTRADTKSVSESKFTVMKLPKQYSFIGTLSAWCSVSDWYDGLLSKAKCYWISVSNLTAWPRYPWWEMNFNLWTIRCWHWVGYSSVRFSKLCSVMEDAPPPAERSVVPQDGVNDSQAQHHLAQILWPKQWLSGSSWGHTLLQFLLLLCFFTKSGQYLIILRTSGLINLVRVSCVVGVVKDILSAPLQDFLIPFHSKKNLAVVLMATYSQT